MELEDERVAYQSYQKGVIMPCGGKKRKKRIRNNLQETTEVKAPTCIV